MPADPSQPDALQIVYYPAPILRQKAESVVAFDDSLRAIVARMTHLMHEARGVGLAAPQVGLPLRLFVANPTGEPGDDHVFINPKLTEPSRETAPHEEGCLSIPGVYADVTRPIGITITAQNQDGETFSLQSDELAARVWQHEFDHLEGVLILDRMTPIDRRANKRVLAELQDAYE